MDNANYIPLGNVTDSLPFDTRDRPQGKTKEERKRIAREIRLAAKREKKKIKSDAKKQRKQNAILHRRATRNNEKYDKNRDRNCQRAIDLERHRIRISAVRQAENLAAKYDPSGKSFNVGAVTTLEDGTVKSIEKMKLAAEKKAAEAAGIKLGRKEDGQQQVPSVPAEGGNPQRQALIEKPVPVRMSKKQQKRLAMYAPKPVPPRPILPEGVTIPEAEEDFISQFDISDEAILKRLADQKKKKSQAARALRVKQKQESRFRKAMKLRKKAADRLGVLFDAEAAKREILGLDQKEEEEKKKSKKDRGSDSDFNSESTSDSESDSDSDSESESDEDEEKVEKPIMKPPRAERPYADIPKTEEPNAKAFEEARKGKKEKAAKKSRPAQEEKETKGSPEVAQIPPDSADDVVMENTQATGTKRSADNVSTPNTQAERKKKRSKHAPEIEEASTTDQVDEEEALKEKKRLRKEKKLQAKAAADTKPEDSPEQSLKESKKRKHEDEPTEELAQNGKSSKSHKKRKSTAEEPPAVASNGQSNEAEQWNADALPGDAARKKKFLRLLGAGKANRAVPESKSKKATKDAAEISHVEAELQRQFEAGVKMKYDGQGKRRGLGA